MTSASTHQIHQQALNKDISKYTSLTSGGTQQRHQQHAFDDRSYLLMLSDNKISLSERI